ncbi:MAG: hypothetical protein GY805_19925 [Chloroflexi bacterium]|nr:hypothetical protein [Chloroflexota bacterium]
MSEALDQVVERAVNDKKFRRLLLSNLDKALEGYAVSDEERGLLENLDDENFDEFAGGLGSRTTKGIWPGTG